MTQKNKDLRIIEVEKKLMARRKLALKDAYKYRALDPSHATNEKGVAMGIAEALLIMAEYFPEISFVQRD